MTTEKKTTKNKTKTTNEPCVRRIDRTERLGVDIAELCYEHTDSNVVLVQVRDRRGHHVEDLVTVIGVEFRSKPR